MSHTDYERRANAQIHNWETAGPSKFERLGRLATRPAEWVLESMLPATIKDAAGESLYRLLTHANEAVHLTVPTEPILSKARSHGHEVFAHEDLRARHLPLSDDLATHFIRPHLMTTVASGAACGAGGIALLGIDIPALFAVNLRMVQHTAVCYGYNLSDPLERHYALTVFQAAAGDPRTKMAMLQELALVRAALTRAGLDAMAERSVMAAAAVSLRAMAQKVGIEITERKLLQLVPLVGMGIGAGFNYLFSKQIATASVMGYRKRFLAEKYPEAYPSLTE